MQYITMEEVEMPIVQVRYKNDGQMNEIVRSLAQVLPEIVAPAMSTDSYKVDKKNIVVNVDEVSDDDVNPRDLQIMIIVEATEGRTQSLEGRKNVILQGIQRSLGEHAQDIKGFVWILPIPTTALGQI
jgi:phenylpyruvate tautomerase PptA (4-oxalocrotonate tautomerase family)